MKLQKFVDQKELIKALRLKLQDDTITMATHNELKEKLEAEVQTFNKMARYELYLFLSFAKENPELFPNLDRIHHPDYYRLVSVKFSETKSAIKVLLSETRECDTHYWMYLIPFDFMEDREKYIARRKQYIEGQKIANLTLHVHNLENKVQEYSQKLDEAQTKITDCLASHTNAYGEYSQDKCNALKYA